MAMSHFPNGFASGVTVRNIPVLTTHGKNAYWVDSADPKASNSNDGSFQRPWATVAYAVNSSNNTKIASGDTVFVKPGHTETVSAAGTITMNKAGVNVVGLGTADRRPIFTWSATAATWAVSAANCSVQNVVCTNSIDGVTKAFNITAAGFLFQGDAVDSTSLIEFQRFILGSTAADNMYVDLRYRGQTGGDNCVAPVQLNGTDEGIVNIDFYGKASTAVVNFITTACTGIRVTGKMYNSGTTDGSKNVVDTITGSTWMADVFDGAAGTTWRGGSGAASGATLNGGQVNIATKRFAAAGSSLTTGLSPVTCWTVTGKIVGRVYGYIDTALASTLNNGTLAIGVSGNTGSFIAATTADGTNFPTGSVWAGDTSPTLKSEVFSSTALNWAPLNNTNIIATIATNSMTAGDITLVLEWRAISSGASVT